jgi:carboxyl-terminal processing protease
MFKKTIVAFCVIVMVLTFILLTDADRFGISAQTKETYENLKIFSDVMTIIQKNYVDQVDVKDLIYNSIKGMVSNLDPHSSFMPPDMYKEMQVETTGTFGGLGIEITIKDGILTVVSPIEDTPAYRAGIKTGDKIIKIGNEHTKNMSLMDAVKKMRGKPGTEIIITIMREQLKEPKEFTIKRDSIKIKSVKSRMIENKYGYIRLSQFQENTAKEFKQALKSFESDNNKMSGIILDLRGNPGGLLDQAVKISDEFLDSGLIVYTEGRIEKQKIQFNAKKNSKPFNYPCVVLVNGGSASASEIVAGALKDHGKAIIVGTQTFGKGTVQTIFPLDDGSGLRITTAKYFTPSHKSIQEKGITPDIIVEDNIEKSHPSGKPKFIREKDLEHHFKGENINDDKEGDDDNSSENKEADIEDDPLRTALNILKSWEIFMKHESNQAEN